MGTKRGLKRNNLELTLSDVFLHHLHLLTVTRGQLLSPPAFILPEFLSRGAERTFRGPPGAADTGATAWAQPSVGRGAPLRAGPHLQQEGGLSSSAPARGGWPWGLGLAPGREGSTCAHPQSVCPQSARTPVPPHDSRHRPQCNRLSPQTWRACEEGRPAPARLAAGHPQPGVGAWASHVPESPGQPSPSSRAASLRPETPAEGLSVHFRSPLHPLSDPSGGRGPDPRLDRDPSVSLGLPPAPRDPADSGGDSRPQGPLHSWNEILVLCALPSAV